MWFIKLLKSAMAILSNMSQQTLFRRTWSESSKRLYNENRSPVMKIMGKVSGHVSLSDLGKNIAFGQIVELTESDITRSKDLQDAIRMKWVDVIENRSMILRAPAVVVEQKKEEMNKEELIKWLEKNCSDFLNFEVEGYKTEGYPDEEIKGFYIEEEDVANMILQLQKTKWRNTK